MTTDQKTRTAKKVWRVATATKDSLRNRKRNPALLQEFEQALSENLDPAFLEELVHPSLIKATVDTMTRQAARFAVLEVHKVAKERFGEKLDAALIDWSVDSAVKHHAADLLTNLRADSRRPLTLGLITKTLALGFFLEMEETGETVAFGDGFDRKAFTERARAVIRKHGRENFALHGMKAAETLSKNLIARHDPENRSLAQITNFLRAGRQNTTAIATSKVAAAVNRLVASPDPDIFTEEQVVAYVDGRPPEKIKVRGEINPRAMLLDYPDLSIEKQAEVQENITKQLLGMKERGAGLLKVHLDLTSEAFNATQISGADLPLIEYKLTDALERQGYTKNLSRNAFHPDTVEQLRRRLQALYHHKVSIFVPSGKTSKEQERVNPTWIVQEERSNRPSQHRGDEAPPGLFGLPEAKNYTSAIMQPGLWWYYASMGRQWIALPSSVLTLSTDEHGKEAERYAFLIANFLAIRVRTSQKRHAGKRASYSVGHILEEAQITTKNQFFTAHPEAQKRIRNYLHDLDGKTGALPLLDHRGAFHVTIRDEDEFFASGRGWTERFWEAILDVDIPDLGVRQKGLGS